MSRHRAPPRAGARDRAPGRLGTAAQQASRRRPVSARPRVRPLAHPVAILAPCSLDAPFAEAKTRRFRRRYEWVKEYVTDPQEPRRHADGLRGRGVTASMGLREELSHLRRELVRKSGRTQPFRSVVFLAGIQSTPSSCGRCTRTGRLERRGWDSNPRGAQHAQRFSRPPRSTAPAPRRMSIVTDLSGGCSSPVWQTLWVG